MVRMGNHYGANTEEEGRQRDVPLVAGTVVTRRWFNVNTFGQLTSPIYSGTWPSWKGEAPWFRATCTRNWSDPFSGVVLDSEKTRRDSWGSQYYEEHTVGSYDCACGFYSFYRTPKLSIIEFGQANAVGAVVENCGRITYGDKGIRSQKMRVRAFVLNVEPPASPWNFIKFYTDFLGFFVAFAAWLLIALIMVGVGWLLNIWLTEQTATMIAWYGVWGVWLTALIVVYLMNAGLPFTWSVAANDGRLASLKERYPDVPVFNTWKEADKAFPHTKRKDLP